MRSVGIKVLKNKLSEYVRLAAGGETILVTDRDQVVAQIVPPRGGPDLNVADSLLAEAVRKGWVRPPLWPPGQVPGRAPVASFQELLDELKRDRNSR